MKTTITAHCRIITPMMAAGADQQQFEIRASEVKAALRFWWRVFQPLEKQELFKAEKKLFGSTEGASPFRLSATCELTDRDLWKPGQVHNWGKGIQYVFFATNIQYQSARSAKGNIQARPERQAQLKGPADNGRAVAKPEEKGGPQRRFTLRLRPDRLSPKATGDLLCALWLLENLGGLGGRTRRGAGCFEIEELKIGESSWNAMGEDAKAYGEVPSFSLRPDQTSRSFIDEGVKIIQRRWGNGFAGTISDHTSFYNPGKELLVLSSSRNSARDVLDQIGLWFKAYCHKNPLSEAQKLHGALEGAITPPVSFNLSKAARGLPINYNFSGTRGKYRATFDDAGNEGRRSSPLLISCHERGSRGYAVVCHFPAQLLPPGKDLQLKLTPPGRAWTGVLPSPNQDFIKKMLHQSRTNQRGEEIASLCNSLGEWCDAVTPQAGTTGTRRQKDAEKKLPSPNLTPDAKRLVRDINGMRTMNNFGVKKILMDLEKIQADDEKGASKAAMALKAKLLEKDHSLWKNYQKSIESYFEKE